MTKVIKWNSETRQHYLLRVARAFIKENYLECENIFYDGVECDGHCLAEDIEIELDIYDENDIKGQNRKS